MQWKGRDFKQYPTQVLGTQMVSDLTKPPCTRMRQAQGRYAKSLGFKPFSQGVLSIYEGLQEDFHLSNQ